MSRPARDSRRDPVVDARDRDRSDGPLGEPRHDLPDGLVPRGLRGTSLFAALLVLFVLIRYLLG